MKNDVLDAMGVQLKLGDCLESLRLMADNSVDSIVTDPPYGLKFMGKKWDYDVPSVDIWRECLRVLKPGGHLLAFAGTRTQHRMAVRIEDAGFEIRDMIAWVYGCLDEDTEVATDRGVIPYHKAKIGDRALCYDVEHGEYTYQPILEIVEYDYSDTAYRLVGDFGEQVVSRNHRVIVERGGIEAFQFAEALQCEARVPVLESLPALRQALHDARSSASGPQQNVQHSMQGRADRCRERGRDATGSAQGCDDPVRGLRGERLEADCVASQGADADMQQTVQRRASWRGMGDACSPGAGQLDAGIRGVAEGANDGRIEPRMEGRADLSESEGCVCGSADQVRALSDADAANGAVGRLCDGASAGGCAGDRPCADPGGVRSPHQSRCDRQPAGQPDAFRDEQRPQGVRAWGGHRSSVVRVVPFHYTGKVWCLRVPTGAFVAVRNGVAFPTGNSGFPKSLDVSKAIDKAEGAEGGKGAVTGSSGSKRNSMAGDFAGGEYHEYLPATEAARQWQGWGTALKPALEPITVARKPLIGTVAANVLEHGTGALNIDGCRVGDEVRYNAPAGNAAGGNSLNMSMVGMPQDTEGRTVTGRWPANLIHDGSDDVLAAFPQAPGQQGRARTDGAAQGNAVFSALNHVTKQPEPRGDMGSAARFFYCAKASKRDRDEGLDHLPAVDRPNGNKWTDTDYRVLNGERGEGRESGPRRNVHPTVKPTDLMRYLCRLVTPPGGTVLDAFMGSGSTGKAAVLEGFNFIGCEISPDSMAIAQSRILNAIQIKNDQR